MAYALCAWMPAFLRWAALKRTTGAITRWTTSISTAVVSVTANPHGSIPTWASRSSRPVTPGTIANATFQSEIEAVVADKGNENRPTCRMRGQRFPVPKVNGPV
ncbi:hypothetical protein IWX90DRAFT_280177 [Phyllosticta citrichinensis]|uniref:Secreted protein n=1 Tax=Phyllosticta citrichinensis TaxID=1130410 RepID=A0ABR1XNN0_9PEZI